MMLPFREIAIGDKPLFDSVFGSDCHISGLRLGSDFSFANNFVWRRSYNIEVCELGELCLTRSRYIRDGALTLYYGYPFGKKSCARRTREAVCALFDDALRQNECLRFRGLTESDKSDLELLFPGVFDFVESRDEFDYIYSAERLTTLAGKKLASKRNHIARFKDNPNWSYEAINDGNLEECVEVARIWYRRYADAKPELEMRRESDAVNEAFGNFRDLNLVGGLLRRDTEPIAFTLGERTSPELLVVIVEKAFPHIQGAYQMINQQFVAANGQDARFINRQEDEGDEGLRRSKLSYYPDVLLSKYVACVKEAVYCNILGDVAIPTGILCEKY